MAKPPKKDKKIGLGKDGTSNSAPAKMTDRKRSLRTQKDSYKAKLRKSTDKTQSTTQSPVIKSRRSAGSKKLLISSLVSSIASTPLNGRKNEVLGKNEGVLDSTASEISTSTFYTSPISIEVSPSSSSPLSTSLNGSTVTPSSDSGIDTSYFLNSSVSSTPVSRNASNTILRPEKERYIFTTSNLGISSRESSPQYFSLSEDSDEDCTISTQFNKKPCLTCIRPCGSDGSKMRPLPPDNGKNRDKRRFILRKNHSDRIGGTHRTIDRLEYNAIRLERKTEERMKRGRSFTPPTPPLVLTAVELAREVDIVKELSLKIQRELYNEAVKCVWFGNIFSCAELDKLERRLCLTRFSRKLQEKFAKAHDRENKIKRYVQKYFVMLMKKCLKEREDIWNEPLKKFSSYSFLEPAAYELVITVTPDTKTMIFHAYEELWEEVDTNDLVKEEWTESGRSEKENFYKIRTTELPEYYISKSLLYWALKEEYHQTWKILKKTTGRAFVNVPEQLKPDCMIEFALYGRRSKWVGQKTIAQYYIEKQPKFHEAKEILDRAVESMMTIEQEVKEK